MLYQTILNYTTLYYTILYYTTLHNSTLYILLTSLINDKMTESLPTPICHPADHYARDQHAEVGHDPWLFRV